MFFQYYRSILYFLVVFCAFFSVSADVLEEARNYFGYESLYAEFEELNSENPCKGKLYVKKPDKLRYESITDEPYTIITKAGNLLYYDHLMEESSYFDADDFGFYRLFVEKVSELKLKITMESENNVLISVEDYNIHLFFEKDNGLKLSELVFYGESDKGERMKRVIKVLSSTKNIDIDDSLFRFSDFS